jgi:hypothetical protein
MPSEPTLGAVICYDERAFPAIVHLEKQGGGLLAVLGPKWWRAPWRDSFHPERAPALSYQPTRGWRVADDVPMPRPDAEASPACAELVPPIPLTVEEAILLRPHVGEVPQSLLGVHQSIGACQQVGDVIWFGISFYDGEGYEGVGGVGRYDLATKRLEVRRPQELRDASVSYLVHDGDSLYVATLANQECVGRPPVSGLLHYEWGESMAYRQPICGFVPHGMVLLDGDLWVASDLGLARGRRGRYGLREWQNYVPTSDPKDPVRETSCAALYESLLDSLPTAAPDPDTRSPWSQLFRNLVRFEPDSEFLEGYVRRRVRPEPEPSPADSVPERVPPMRRDDTAR